MALFRSKKATPSAPRPPWTPTVDETSARPAVFALAGASHATDAQVRAAIAELVRLSEKPTDPLQLARLMDREPDISHRPWVWLRSVMEIASSNGDHQSACAALFWSIHWTFVLVPKLRLGDFMELNIDPIPEALKADIARIGTAAARALPPDTFIVGDETGHILAGQLAEIGPSLTETNPPRS